MEVFYVMVLVLSAVAVPCHGRTESLGTLFNKTQPHESMNNVTVSSSKLEAYGSLFLVMQWPRSFCYFYRCWRVAPDYFTVHGLWPQPEFDPFRQGIDCGLIYRRYRQFNISQLNRVLLPGLNRNWPDLKSTEYRRLWDHNNGRFWEMEYNKHGSCTFDDQNEYFRLTLALVEHLGVLIVNPSRIRGGGFRSGIFYHFRYISEAVYRATNKKPMLRCIIVGDFYYLSEIYFCVDRNSHRLRNCGQGSNCGNRVKIL